MKIFYKYEGGSPSGSHKTNTAVPQIYYNKEAGTKKAGSTMFAPTVTMDKINPKDCQILANLGDSGFLQFLRVVSSDDKANPGRWQQKLVQDNGEVL